MKSLPHSTAKDVFSHLLAIVTLYVGVISFIALYFQYINVKFPDPLQFYYSGALDIIRQSMAALIVVWPVFILISWLINKDMKAEPGKHEIGIRKWLLYLTLFVTAITIIIDLVTLVNYFLNGEITPRFILKVVVVLVTAAAVFWYYLWDLRHESHTKSDVPKKAAWISSIVIVVSIILGFVFVGTPAEQRQVRLDEQRVQDLSIIQSEVINYYGQKRKLPETLTDLQSSLTGFVAPTDPITGEAYEYSIVEPDPAADILNYQPTFELCATFTTSSLVADNKVTSVSRPVSQYDYYSPYGQNWLHAEGRTCFERTIDPAMFPEPVKAL